MDTVDTCRVHFAGLPPVPFYNANSVLHVRRPKVQNEAHGPFGLLTRDMVVVNGDLANKELRGHMAWGYEGPDDLICAFVAVMYRASPIEGLLCSMTLCNTRRVVSFALPC